MVKNRLNELQEKSKSIYSEERIPLKGKKSHFNNNPEEILKLYGDLNERLGTLETLISSVETLERELYSANYNLKDETDKNGDRGALLEEKRREIQKCAKYLQESLGKEKEILQEASEKDDTILRMRNTQFISSSQRLTDLWSRYNASQIASRNKNRNFLVQKLKVVYGKDKKNKHLNEEEIQDILDTGDLGGVFGSQILAEEETARRQLTEIQNRHSEFLKMEASIRQIGEMFADIALLVGQQGEMIDRIDKHVADSANHAENGRKQTQLALKNQKAARKKKMCLMIGGTIAGIILLAIVICTIIL